MLTTPAVKPCTLQAMLATAQGGPARRGTTGFRLLMVEDDARDARLTEIGLSEAPRLVSELTRAEDLTTAINMAIDSRPDVVFLDLGLPDSHGLDTLRRFIEAVPMVPVVVLTHLADDAVAAQALDLGAQDFLVKGRLRGETLARILRFSVERHQLLQMLAERA